MYVYTRKGEEQAKKKGVKPRIAGEPAFCGHVPLHLQYSIAQAWLKKGYVEWKEDEPMK